MIEVVAIINERYVYNDIQPKPRPFSIMNIRLHKFLSILLLLILQQQFAIGQSEPINRNLFFLDDRVIEVTLTTDIKNLRGTKKVPTWQPASIVMKFSDTSIVSEQINVQTRGVYRKTYCDIASLSLNFKTSTSPKLSKLKKLKLVGGCSKGSFNEELLLKEYLVYKMYNHLSTMSFRVRLLHVNYLDSKKKVAAYSQYAFLIEDLEDVADRNNCKEVKTKVHPTESTNRIQMTMVCLFQYMIGNTDFSVPNYHNVKLMAPKTDTLQKPYTIPYDFDYAGIVDAPYAVPREELGIPTVKDRLYRGFPRTMDEVQPLVELFKEKKESIYYTINNFSLLREKARKDMIKYLDGFYDEVSNKRSVKLTFIDNARTF